MCTHTSALPNHLDVQRQANLWHSAILYNHVCFMHDQSTSFLPYEVPLNQRGSINLCFLKLNYSLTCNLKLEIVAHDAEVWPWPSGRSCAVWHYENWQADSSPAGTFPVTLWEWYYSTFGFIIWFMLSFQMGVFLFAQSLSRDCACWHQAMDLLQKDIMVCLVLIQGPRRWLYVLL